MSSYSKREYFMQQLKEKDAIIESLLKEVRSTYALTRAASFLTLKSPAAAVQPLHGDPAVRALRA